MTRLTAVLPEGAPLAPEQWASRHLWIVRLLWLHVPFLAVLGVVRGQSFVHSVGDVVPIAGLALIAMQARVGRRGASCAASVGLLTASAILVHIGHGQIEMHFHFFVILPVISLYHDWRPFLLSIAFVAAEHGIVGLLNPSAVYAHAAGQHAPLQWAAVHAAFVLAESAVCVLSWRIIEDGDRAARAELEASEQRFRGLVEHAADVVTVVDRDGVIVYDSPAAQRVLGYAPEERIGQHYAAMVHEDDLERAADILADLVGGGDIVRGIHLRVAHRDGSFRWVEATLTNLLDDPAVGGLVANFRDITDRKQLEDELAHQAFHDPLTGLANRALLLNRIEHQMATRDNSTPVSLLYLDLDDFKTVNDGLGHHAGDEILRSTAARISSVIRADDTASRLGGDEFAIVLGSVADPATAYEVGQRVLDAVCMPIEVDGGLIAVNASLGIAVSDPADQDAAALLRNADLAMYRAKAAGKSQFAIFEPSMHAAVVDRLSVKADLRRGIDNGEFEPHYQPIVDLRTLEVIGAEALVRWRHPELGLVPPDRFIPLAEETGLIVPLGRRLLRRACLDAAAWRAQGVANGRITLSVNLSPRQIQDRDLVDDIRTALEMADLPAECLTLEITEGVLLENTEAVSVTLAALKAIGVRIALDDFGTGYSSLSYLEQFPVDVVKIDKCFIDSLDGDESSVSPLVSAIVNLGVVLGLDVTAEGIEHPAQLGRLRRMGCAQGQGYAFAKPLPVDEFVRAVEELTTSPARHRLEQID